MSSFSSASQMRDPLPRTMNLGWPPTAPNARTGELTPPGIRAAARFCRRCDCSTLRDVVGSIRSLPYTRKRKRERKAYRWQLAMPAINITADLHAQDIQVTEAKCKSWCGSRKFIRNSSFVHDLAI